MIPSREALEQASETLRLTASSAPDREVVVANQLVDVANFLDSVLSLGVPS